MFWAISNMALFRLYDLKHIVAQTSVNAEDSKPKCP